jgi:hypothetical protein
MAWRTCEPEKGVWDFRQADEQVEQAIRHDVDLIVDVGFVPRWASATPNKTCQLKVPGQCAEPRNIEDWKQWITTIAMRYRGKVKNYEIWNEPNDGGFYTGSVGGLIRLTKVAQEVVRGIDPEIKILSPSPYGRPGLEWMERFLGGGGGEYSDIISFHFYVHPGPPEGVYRYTQQVRKMMDRQGVGDRPLWDTEIGWGHVAQIDEQTAAAYLSRTMLLQRAAGASRVFWYGWGLHYPLDFVESDKITPSPAGEAMKTLEGWLVGAVVESCDSSDMPQMKEPSHAPWTCVLRRGATKSYVVWHPDCDTRFSIPASWQVTRAHDMLGRVADLPSAGQITIHSYPVLLNNAQ